MVEFHDKTDRSTISRHTLAGDTRRHGGQRLYTSGGVKDSEVKTRGEKRIERGEWRRKKERERDQESERN